MKWFLIPIIGLLLVLQYELWIAPGGFFAIRRLRHNIALVKKTNQELQERNDALLADIKDLKHGNEAIEERAREELGMVKKDEVFYQVVGS